MEKKRLKINEVSKLYNIGIDSLRYYEEIGLLAPTRGENGYRYYGQRELMILNIIVEYRNMNLSLSQIRDIIGTRSIQENLEILRSQTRQIDAEIARLSHKKDIIASKIENSLLFLEEAKNLRPHVKALPDFKCLHITDAQAGPDNIDFYITSYLKESATDLDELSGRYDLYRLDTEAAGTDGICPTKEILIINNAMKGTPDFILPGGEYLIMGSTEANPKTKLLVDELMSYAKAHRLKLCGDVFLLVVFDFYDTSIAEEYLSLAICRIEK